MHHFGSALAQAVPSSWRTTKDVASCRPPGGIKAGTLRRCQPSLQGGPHWAGRRWHPVHKETVLPQKQCRELVRRRVPTRVADGGPHMAAKAGTHVEDPRCLSTAVGAQLAGSAPLCLGGREGGGPGSWAGKWTSSHLAVMAVASPCA